MDRQFLRLYNDELAYMRDMGAEFARAFPKIAGRLGMEGDEVADPYVERLIESFAFMAARVQHKLQARFPAFTQHLLEQVYPHFLAPVPSMAMLRFMPDPQAGRLDKGFLIPRGTRLFSQLAPGTMTHCEFRTAQDVRIWPLTISHVDYYAVPSQVSALALPDGAARAALRVRLKTTNGVSFDRLALRVLTLHCLGAGGIGAATAEHLLTDCIDIVARPTERPFPWQERIAPAALRQVGLEPEAALLPQVPRSFDGYRLLQEYFSLPQRGLFVELSGLADSVARSSGDEMEIIFVFRRAEPRLERQLGPQNFALFATPAINLFERQADRIQLSDRHYEHHVVLDRLRGLDLELHSILDMEGVGEGEATEPVEFRPFYNLREHGRRGTHQSYYTLRREQRMLSEQQRLNGSRSGYIGSEAFVSLVDSSAAPYPDTIRHLAIRCLCSNRDLPLLLQPGRDETDFTLEIGAPVTAVRCIGVPSRPLPSPAQGDVGWKLVSHLSLNYLSITGSDEEEAQGAEALRELLRLYVDAEDVAALRQIDGIRSIRSRPVVRRLPGRGQSAVARGVEITVTLDEAAFEGLGIFPLGSVLSHFFAKYVSVNSFTETVLASLQRGEIRRWPMMLGLRAIV
ncbi:type VI secretion system baseplate subunit TssF [Roseomonas marmotae]|uniref:Type VI secretion system baseplate subunit TssF n=1 Tax=Roseomonas marmotae TaxID=2768161 RepID=A0ABS3K8B8_9PROT|nr:type VI secretion system baseplate subunit TssF [Roseomonas marmotae]MBO1073704.1 type VI secretion system baseplate subunit TssF [Roseomonas marmotae]QTI78656.1 type VI secretion system baseplate subunit TssF [Roseomonas marmotae]